MQQPRNDTPQPWHRTTVIRERLQRFLKRRGYEIIDTPVLEQTDLFLRKSGGELASRMYSFTDPSGRRVSLRPEFTSSVVREFVEGALAGPMPQRWQYCGPVFRYEAGDGGAQAFQQLGAELLGVTPEVADAEVLALSVQGLTALGVKGHSLRVGHMGVVNTLFEALGLSERARVFVIGSLGVLRDGGDGLASVRERAAELGLLSERRASELISLAQRLDDADAAQMVQGFLSEAVTGMTGQRTPEEVFLRYLRKLREAEDPATVEKALALAAELVGCRGPAADVRPKLGKLVAKYGLADDILAPVDRLLVALSVYDLQDVPVVLDLGTARGIAYYTGVVFDIEHRDVVGAPALGGGGRYDGLVKALGGVDDVPALGFAYTVERISQLLPEAFGDEEEDGLNRVLVVAQETAIGQAVETAERLRVQGIPAELDMLSRTDADAARYARKRGIQTVMRVGSDGAVQERSL